jgi:hypothetical protein
LAGDTNDLSVTRWLATDEKIVAEYQVGKALVNKECEQIYQIPTTTLAVVMYDATDEIILIDFLSMTLARNIVHPSDTYDEGKCEHATFWSGEFLLVCVQETAASPSEFHLNAYNYSDGIHSVKYDITFLTGTVNAAIRLVFVKDTPFFLVGLKNTVIFFRMPNSGAFVPSQADRLGQNSLMAAQWYPPQNKFLVTLFKNQELIGAIRAPSFCSYECATRFSTCAEDKPFFPDGCATCFEGGLAPVNGKCPSPVSGAYGVTQNTLTNGNGQFVTSINVNAASIAINPSL